MSAYEKNASKRVVKHPKGYLRDSELLHHLLHLQRRNDALAHPRMGASWQGMVVETLLRGFAAHGTACQPHHYRTGAGAEVDLVLEGEFGLLPVEIKHTQHVDARGLRALRDFVTEHGCRYGVVVHNDEQVRLLDERLIGVPLAAL